VSSTTATLAPNALERNNFVESFENVIQLEPVPKEVEIEFARTETKVFCRFGTNSPERCNPNRTRRVSTTELIQP
jgi:hypothetical protein